MTLRWDGTWRRHQATAEAYTLAGRMPVVVNPIDFRASFIEVHPDRPLTIINSATGKLAPETQDQMGLLTFFSTLSAANLLVVLPLLLFTGRLGAWWRWILEFAIFAQIGIAVEVFWHAKPWRSADNAGFWRNYIPLLLNPLGALRSGDILLKGLSQIPSGEPQQAN